METNKNKTCVMPSEAKDADRALKVLFAVLLSGLAITLYLCLTGSSGLAAVTGLATYAAAGFILTRCEACHSGVCQ